MCTNQSNAFNEKQAVFEEINNWARHINSAIWLITSFFIALNFMAIKIVFSDLGKCYAKSYFGGLCLQQRLFLGIVVFMTLWLIPALCVLSAMATTEKLSSLLKNPDSIRMQVLSEKLTLRCDDYKEVLKAIRFPCGWIIAAFTVLFLLAWIWIFFYFIP